MQIKGTVTHQQIGPGFWGIIDEDGQKWRPLKMPKKLQKEGLKVEIQAKKSLSQISIFAWGTAIEITDYVILS